MSQIPYIDVHTHRTESGGEGTVAVRNIFPGQADSWKPDHLYSVGLHPWFIKQEQLDKDLQSVKHAARNDQVVAIGETGLDRMTDVPIDLQKKVFASHLEIAAKYGKPVIIHAVKTYPDIVEVYKNKGLDVVLIFHGFNGNRQIADQLLRHGFYLSFGEVLLRGESKASSFFINLPKDYIFLETDESEKNIEDIYMQAANLSEMKVEALKQQIHRNFVNCFGDLP